MPAVYLHFALLLLVQSAYAWLWIHSPYLQGAFVIPTLYRLLTWTLPPFLLLRSPLDYLKLRTRILPGLLWGFVLGLALFAANYVAAPHLRWGFGWRLWLGAVLLVGLSEEVLFRGYFLGRLTDRLGFWGANLIQSILFVAIHVPGWALMGNVTSHNIAYVLALAFALGYVVRRTNSLWAAMLIHSFNNLATFALKIPSA